MNSVPDPDKLVTWGLIGVAAGLGVYIIYASELYTDPTKVQKQIAPAKINWPAGVPPPPFLKKAIDKKEKEVQNNQMALAGVAAGIVVLNYYYSKKR